MKLFCILNPARVVAAALATAAFSANAAAASTPDLLVRDLVMTSLLRGLGATEVTPVPMDSPACLLVAPMQGADGTPVVAPTARLMQVETDPQRDVLRELSVTFGGSGVKVKDQLVLLTGELKWLNQQEGGAGSLLTLTFERGPFKGFFTGAPRMKSVIRIAQVGDELCVAAS